MKKIKRPKKKVEKLSSNYVETPRAVVDGYFSGFHNEALSIFHLYQFINLNYIFNAWDPVDDLDQVIQYCAHLSLAHINPDTLQFDIADIVNFLMQKFNGLKLMNQHLINSYLFPEAMKLISIFADMNVIDYEGYQNIEDRLDGLPDEIAIVIQERLDKPMLISGVEQQQYITRLSAVVASELKYCDIDEFERHLSDVNQFVIMLTGTRIRLEPTTH